MRFIPLFICLSVAIALGLSNVAPDGQHDTLLDDSENAEKVLTNALVQLRQKEGEVELNEQLREYYASIEMSAQRVSSILRELDGSGAAPGNWGDGLDGLYSDDELETSETASHPLIFAPEAEYQETKKSREYVLELTEALQVHSHPPTTTIHTLPQQCTKAVSSYPP